MNEKSVKTCVICNNEKSFNDFYNKCRECELCISKRVLKRYFNDIVRILQQLREKCARFKDLDNRLKALEEERSVNIILT